MHRRASSCFGAALGAQCWSFRRLDAIKPALKATFVDRTAHVILQAVKKRALLASISGSASSASFENLKPQVNSSPQNRTCSRFGAVLPITRCRALALLRVSSALQLAIMHKHAPVGQPC